MPTIPTYTKCSDLGCKEERQHNSSYCAIHSRKKEMSEERWMNQQEYKSQFWKSTKRRQLSSAPLCASCLLRGRVCQANHCDHVFPWTKIGKHAFENNIFQSLCAECQSHKTQLEQRGVVEWYRHDKLETLTIDDYSLAMRIYTNSA